MIASIDEKRAELFALCRRFHVRRLELFGSAATGEFDPTRSDFDFLVDFERPPGTNAFHQYFDFQRALSELLGHRVDLVTAGSMRNPYFVQSVNKSRVSIYAA